eukprot:CAMPEP_0181523492 /NCGR_PEP_ID=MMETSP1110-20121109/67928_1 /TAXON_ID=174948 /ORGANISM="Symbiodinium sp., Strain CCMP421" /LENGTH=62 /DNA_ID=CAMNT_0023654163 /DNA_START=248 /DNA_END=436 /DNA_ORIENTATION=+
MSQISQLKPLKGFSISSELKDVLAEINKARRISDGHAQLHCSATGRSMSTFSTYSPQMLPQM